MRSALILMTGLCLAACGQAAPTNAPSTAAADAAPAAPTHNWTVNEGGEYGYTEGLSKDQQDSGVAAAKVIMFRYLGERDGHYRLASADNPSVVASCANPCEVVKVTGPGQVQRMTFSSDSVIGAAFTDAFNGQLDVYSARSSRNGE